MVKVVSVDEVKGNSRHGGDVRALLTPGSVAATSGFMGVAFIAPGERITQHYHPFSEEFVYVAEGCVVADLEGDAQELQSRQAIMIPINIRHRFVNESHESVMLVFFLSPLAPRPDLGHVDTE